MRSLGDIKYSKLTVNIKTVESAIVIIYIGALERQLTNKKDDSPNMYTNNTQMSSIMYIWLYGYMDIWIYGYCIDSWESLEKTRGISIEVRQKKDLLNYIINLHRNIQLHNTLNN
jgi:hypothetical protein